MATGRVRIGWSLRAPKTETRIRPENRFGWKSITKTKPADTRNPNGYPKPADIYTHIHMYKQEATNNKYFHESTLNKFNNLSKQIISSIL